MLFTDTSTNMKSKKPAGQVGCSNPVCLPLGEIASLSDAGLTAELSLLDRSESRLAARKAKLLAELANRSSGGDAQQLATSELTSFEHACECHTVHVD